MTDYEALAKRVEGGGNPTQEVLEALGLLSPTGPLTLVQQKAFIRNHHARAALYGSLDAAKALHEAVLPGWAWSVRTNLVYDEYPHEAHVWQFQGNRQTSEASTPAAAWVAAILRAKGSP